MMEVNDELVDKLAHLARLHFECVEKTAIKKDLQQMIVFIQKLNELDTTDIEPLLHISDQTNRFREDAIENNITRGEALANAPVGDNLFFKVPKVIKK